MNARNLLGGLLIIVGCISLGYSGITYTRREKVLQVGSLVATADKTETLPLSPWVGAAALVAGIAVMTVRRET